MKLLVVEDERLMAETIRAIVGTIPSVKRVDVARDYPTALRKLASSPYCLALIDIHLANPLGNGLDLCRAIRQTDPLMPILIISSDTSIETLEKAFGATVNDYIRKPFFPKELVLRVKRWLPLKNRLPSQPPITYSQLTYVPHHQEFFWGNQRIALTRKSKALMLLLFQKRERILDQDFLREKLWGDYDSLEKNRNLRSNIQILRRALKKYRCDRWIVTVRGEGYMMKKDN